MTIGPLAPTPRPTLWHYTCAHGYARLGVSGHLHAAYDLIPEERHGRLMWMASFIWLTDLPTPNSDALGLTRFLIACDRTKYRYRVTDDSDVFPWMEVRRVLPRDWLDDVETLTGVRPRHWWLATKPIPVVYDPARQPNRRST